MRLWNAKTGILERVLGGHGGDVDHVQFSPDGKWVASAGADRSIRLWSVDGTEANKVLWGHESTVYRVDFDASGERLVCGG